MTIPSYNEEELNEELLRIALQDVKGEVIRATKKFSTFNSAHEGYAVILEELDEMFDAIKANQNGKARAEAVQVAAMAVRFILDVQ